MNRYTFDFKLCTYERGWCQIDTHQDASYFGIWTSPSERRIVTYCEGDLTTQYAASDTEYRQNLVHCLMHYRNWNEKYPHAMIDMGIRTRPEMRERFNELGLASYCY